MQIAYELSLMDISLFSDIQPIDLFLHAFESQAHFFPSDLVQKSAKTVQAIRQSHDKVRYRTFDDLCRVYYGCAPSC